MMSAYCEAGHRWIEAKESNRKVTINASKIKGWEKMRLQRWNNKKTRLVAELKVTDKKESSKESLRKVIKNALFDVRHVFKTISHREENKQTYSRTKKIIMEVWRWTTTM